MNRWETLRGILAGPIAIYVAPLLALWIRARHQPGMAAPNQAPWLLPDLLRVIRGMAAGKRCPAPARGDSLQLEAPPRNQSQRKPLDPDGHEIRFDTAESHRQAPEGEVYVVDNVWSTGDHPTAEWHPPRCSLGSRMAWPGGFWIIGPGPFWAAWEFADSGGGVCPRCHARPPGPRQPMAREHAGKTWPLARHALWGLIAASSIG